MARDPRIDLVINAQPSPTGRLAARLAELEREVAQLKAGYPTIQTLTGTPAGSPRAGTPALATDTARLWLHVGGGTWKYTALA